MSQNVKVLVLTGYGLNCDHETAHTFELAGAVARRVHINDLISGQVSLDDFQIMVFGGGFSWGDDHGAGVIQAVRMKTNIGDEMIRFIENGKLVIGICNGFQTLVNLGLLPGIDGDYQSRSVALTHNDCGNFRDAWVKLKVNGDSPCIFTRGFEEAEFPVRHGEGKFYASDAVLKQLEKNSQIVMQYASSGGDAAGGRFPDNPNGSMMDIAAICDITGRVFGLMPHPEAYHHVTHHPGWSRHKNVEKRQDGTGSLGITPGVKLFKNAVDYFK